MTQEEEFEFRHRLEQEQAAGIPKNPISNAMLPAYSANKAIVGLGDAVLNAPTNLYNLAKAGVGSAAIAAGHPEYAPDISPTPDFLANAANRAGFDVGQHDLTPGQRVADAAMQGGTSGLLSPANSLRQMLANALYGSASGGSGGAVTEATGNPALGMAASMAAPLAIQRATAQVPNPNAVKEETINRGREAGYVLPPSEMSPNGTPGFITRQLEGLGGKAAMGQSASIRNQQTTNDLVRRDLGLGGQGQISPAELDAARHPFFDVYNRVGRISPDASIALREWRQANNDARSYDRHYQRSADPQSQQRAQIARNQADGWQQVLEQEAMNSGHPDLINQLRDARVNLARIGSAESALNDATGDISARELAKMQDNGVPLNGGMREAANFSQAFPRFTQNSTNTNQPGVNNLQALASVLLGAGVNPALGAVPFLSPLTRAALYSRPAQSLASPGNSAAKQALIDLLRGQGNQSIANNADRKSVV